MACGILVPQPGIEPMPPVLEGRVLATGPPGKQMCTPDLWSDVPLLPVVWVSSKCFSLIPACD